MRGGACKGRESVRRRQQQLRLRLCAAALPSGLLLFLRVGALRLHLAALARRRVGVLVLHVRRPEREVVAQQLHDERAVLVRLLAERVELRDRLVERLLREVARALGRVEDLVVEDREVEREAEADRVRRREVDERDVLRVSEDGAVVMVAVWGDDECCGV